MIRPKVPWPTGTVMGCPVLETFSERFFTHTLDDELEALERALRAALAADGDPAVES